MNHPPAVFAVPLPVEQFPTLQDLPCRHGFIGRVPGLDVNTDRTLALARLDDTHRRARQGLGLATRFFATAEQVHGHGVAVLAAGDEPPASPLPGVDGLVTNRPGVCLGIYVADCCAIFLVDSRQRAVGLVHSGRKGTELNILAVAVETMRARFGSQPADLVAQLSPCIRPPWYEVDFAAQIVAQCRAAGITRVTDSGVCTAAHPDRYYSYRRKKGRTGRMLALLALD